MSAVLLLVLAIINYYIVRFRGNELTLADFKAIGTALTVAGQYDYSIDTPFVYGIVLILLYCFAIFCVTKYTIIRNKINVIVSIVSVAVNN